MNDPSPAEVLRRAKPIPTYGDHPTTTPHDVVGLDPHGAACTIEVLGATEPVLLLFLSAGCLGCADLWQGTDALRAGLPSRVRLALITRGPEREEAAAIAALAPPGTTTLMSDQAFVDYRVVGPPFLVVVDAERVRTEGVAWGITETLRAALVGLEGR